MQDSAVIFFEGFCWKLEFPHSPDHVEVECGADITAAPGNVLHSSSWQWSGGFQQEWRTTSFQRRKKDSRKRTIYNQTIVEEALLFWAKLKLEPDVLHSDAARMLNTFINDCNSRAIWLFTELTLETLYELWKNNFF